MLLETKKEKFHNNLISDTQALTSYERYILSKEIAANKKIVEKVTEEFANEANKKFVLVKNIRNGKI